MPMTSRILDVRIDVMDRTGALAKCRSFLYDAKQHQIATVNPELIMEASKNSRFKKVLNDCDLCLADGVGVVWATKILEGLKIERIPGVDLILELSSLAAEGGFGVFLLGGRNGAAERTAQELRGKHPNLRIAGYSESLDSLILIQKGIKTADIVFVALGAPKQEIWIAENLPNLRKVKIAMGVGGSFDFISGKIKRAPRPVRSLGLEWLWRFMRQPWRMARIIRSVIIFPLTVVLTRIRSK
jgi:N-acetylglucosaminyldiphosphoundecaprenol N-acetyl-beta-D-mannosaminyltransferase